MKENTINKKFLSIQSQTPNEPNFTFKLRPHRRVDYYEEFSDGDQDEFIEEEEKINNLPRKITRAKRGRPKSSSKSSHIMENQEKTEKSERKEYNDIKDSFDINYNSSIGSIIDIKTISKNEQATNSQMILLILELCLNSKKYGIESDSCSRGFWEQLSLRDDLFFYLKQFKPETLRKYWRTLRKTNKFKKLISSIKEYKDKLNDEKMKLLSSIKAISDYVINPGRGIDYYIQRNYINSYSKNKHKKYFEEEDGSKEEVEEEEEERKLNSNEEAIVNIIEGLENCFPNVERDKIINALISVNGNPENAYLYLKDKENFGFLAFNEEDDKNILELDDLKKQDNKFINKKGYVNIQLRKEFLINKK